jgi:hypothetical protein
MEDDLRFCSLDQWPSDIRKDREDTSQEGGARPCLTLDKINQYIVQVVNDVRQGKPGINVRPQDDAADIETAKMLKGLVRNIEDQSKADVAYASAVESAARIGLGYLRVTTEYVDESSFDQELFIKAIPNTFSVYLGKHIMPDGSDAEEGFVIEAMPVAEFKEKFPKAKAAPGDFEGLDKASQGYWLSEETITVAEYYCFENTESELLHLADGSSMTAEMYAKWPEGLPKVEVTGRRTTIKKQLKWYKMTGVEILDRRDLSGQFIPIIEVVGREAWIDGKRVLWGLVRPAKDALRMYNYWASMITEKLALAPKVPFIGAVGQFATGSDRWKQANKKNFAYLEYDPIDVNGNALPRPERVGPTPIEAAMLKQMEVIEHDVQTALGIFKAGIGESESQQSGRAILALQRESDTGTYHFGANLGVSIRHAGRILVDLIPHYYDTKRIVRILGEDGEVKTAQLDPELQTAYQQPAHPQAHPVFNPGVGKYDVSITVGPSYNTKRMEAAATFVELAKGAADPVSASLLRYLTVRNSDFNGADEAAKALKALLPPPVIQAISGQQPVDPAAQAQIAQLQQQLQLVTQELQQEQAGTKQAAMKVSADHDAKLKGLQLDSAVAAQQADLERKKAEAEYALKRMQIEEDAKLAREKADAELKLKRFQFEQENELADLAAGAEHQRETQKIALQKEKQDREAADKQATKDATEAESLAPQLLQAFEKMLQQNAQFNAQLIAELKKDDGKTQVIKLTGIQKGATGITGATATIN